MGPMVQTPHQWRCRSGGSHLVHHKDLHHKDCNKVHLDHFQQGPQHGPQGLQQGLQHGRHCKEKDFKMWAARHHKPFMLLVNFKGATRLSQLTNQPRVCQMMGHGGGESDEVPRPTIFTAAFGTVYHVRPSCGKLRCASRRLAHAGRCSVVG